ncbi:MAG TPA: hypothetical protein VGW33_09315 [Terriglobia bacterium]|nr:hypothetical protein [Terriglobia bacterium]
MIAKNTERRVSLTVKCLALAFGSLLLCSCNVSRKVDTAKQAVERFHNELKAGDDDRVYDDADSAYRTSVSRQANHELLMRVRRKMGQFQRAEYQSFLMSAVTQGTFVALKYKAQFTNGDLEEQFTFRLEGEHATLVRYQASSPISY